MKSALSTLALGLVGLVAATPVPDSPSKVWQSNGQEVVSYIAKFDDENAGLLADLPVRGVTPLGPYDNLYYDNLGVISSNPGVTGLRAQSAPNVIAYDAVAEAQGQQRIYADYDDSITDHFNFKSFYFGCVVSSQETADSLPQSCTIKIAGFRNQKQVATQTATFTSTGLLVPMKKITLNSAFSNVDAVTFDTQGALTSTLLGVLLDNLAYDVYLKKGYSYSK